MPGGIIGLQTGSVGRRQAAEIAADHPGGIGVAAVQQHLYFRCPACAQIRGETVPDHQCQPHLAAIQQRPGLLISLDTGGRCEIAGGAHHRHQVAALGAVVPVQDGGGDVLHIHIDGIAEDHRLQGRDDEQHDPHARVAEDLDELLDQHGTETIEHITGSSF